MPDFSFLDDQQPAGQIRIRTTPYREQVFSVRKKEPSKAMGCLLLCLMVVGCVLITGNTQNNKGKNLQPEDGRIEAVVASRYFIKQMLKAPSTAKFPGSWDDDIERHATKMADGTYEVDSYVDAQNSFGAMIRTRYRVRLQLLGGGDAKLIEGGLIE